MDDEKRNAVNNTSLPSTSSLYTCTFHFPCTRSREFTLFLHHPALFPSDLSHLALSSTTRAHHPPHPSLSPSEQQSTLSLLLSCTIVLTAHQYPIQHHNITLILFHSNPLGTRLCSLPPPPPKSPSNISLATSLATQRIASSTRVHLCCVL